MPLQAHRRELWQSMGAYRNLGGARGREEHVGALNIEASNVVLVQVRQPTRDVYRYLPSPAQARWVSVTSHVHSFHPGPYLLKQRRGDKEPRELATWSAASWTSISAMKARHYTDLLR